MLLPVNPVDKGSNMTNNRDQQVYGILGSGNANSKIVIDGLADVFSDNTQFLVHARRKPQGAVTTVYDFLADNEASFCAYHRIDDNAPKALLALAEETFTTDDPAKEMLKALSANKGTLLLLWDEENPESSEKFAIMASDVGVPIKDLTDGLAPIVVEGSAPAKEETAPVKVDTEDEYAIVGFTRDELMNMNIGVLRRQAKSFGIENIGRISKEEIVDIILGEDMPEVAADVHVYTEPSADNLVQIAVIVWSDGSSIHSTTVPLEKVKELLS